MIAKNVTMQALEDAAKQVGVRLEYPASLNNEGTRIRFSLKPDQRDPELPKQYRWQATSRGWNREGHKVHAVCWHGHRAFLNELFKTCPTAVVTSMMHGKIVHDGEVDENSKYIPVGPPITGGWPLLGEACICEENR